MKEDLQKSADAKNASPAVQLAVESFLHENYQFRLNVLKGQVEFTNKPINDETPKWRFLTKRAKATNGLQLSETRCRDSSVVRSRLLVFY